MDELIFDKEESTIVIRDYYSEEPIITIYENILETFTFDLKDGEYTAALSKENIDLLIQYLKEIRQHGS